MELKPISSADKKNMKITFYLSEELYSSYKDLQKRAKKQGFKMDLTSDFSVWFSGQLEDAEFSLQKIEKK